MNPPELLTNILGPGAAKQCTYNYSGAFSNVREYLDFNQKLTRWGESGVWGFLSQLNSRPSGGLLGQSIATEARQQMIFRQFTGYVLLYCSHCGKADHRLRAVHPLWMSTLSQAFLNRGNGHCWLRTSSLARAIHLALAGQIMPHSKSRMLPLSSDQIPRLRSTPTSAVSYKTIRPFTSNGRMREKRSVHPSRTQPYRQVEQRQSSPCLCINLTRPSPR